MCGIAGIVTSNQSIDQLKLRDMAATLIHRGPDDLGVFTDGSIGLAHTRLSIIDLSHGHQPLFACDGKLALVANGEIYNYIELREKLGRLGYQFSTHSDCEVILQAYAEYELDFLEHLYGMFAFALYDQSRKRLILARDRLGIKPLFLAHTSDAIAFASELKAFLPLFGKAPEIDPLGLAQYLQYQFSMGATTIFKNVERVLPGEAVCIDTETGKIARRWKYWSARDIEPRDIGYEEAEREFDGLMETVMRQHMRSDVPFGLFLSGGVDSSVLLALLNKFGDEKVRAYSVGFRESRADEEIAFAKQLAQRYTSHHTVLHPERDAMFQRLPFTVWAADELMRDYANMPTAMLAEETGRELKVVFSGEGGDEVFAGYGRYRMSALEYWARNLLAPGTGGFRTRGTFRGRWPRRLFGPELRDAEHQARQPFIDAWRETPAAWSRLQRMQYVDLVTALPDNLMVKADRMLMGWGVEGRVPFLDHRVVEFGLSLPDHLKTDGKQGKLFLKRWAARFVPEEQLRAPKRGFRVPVDKWFTTDLLERLGKILPQHPAMRAWFQPEHVRKLIDSAHGNPVNIRMLWSLLQFAVWHRIFIEGRGERPPSDQDPIDLIS